MTGLRLTLQPGQWRAGPPLVDGDDRPNDREELDVQLVRRTLRLVLDEVDRPTGWVAGQGWWHRDGTLAPLLVRLLVRVEALPEGILTEPGGEAG